MKTMQTSLRALSIAAATLLLASAGSTALASPHPSLSKTNACGLGYDEVLIGQDTDNLGNPLVQPAGTLANQSLNNTDVLRGGKGCDVLIGLLGSDVITGGYGDDVIIGGTEQATAPNSDIMFGGAGDDVSIWAGGDGSEAFFGGDDKDALVFAVIDRDGDNVPTLSPVSGQHSATGLPTADLSNAPGFCTIEPADSLGYDFLVRFVLRATGALAVTVRASEVEQVFCSSAAGGSITYANLKDSHPQFVDISLSQLKKLNPTVGQIVR